MEFFDPHADPKPGFIKEPTADGLLMDSHGDRIFGRYLSPALYKEGERRPVVIMCHGMPGQEQNIDLAQALRRATFASALTIQKPGAADSIPNVGEVEAAMAANEMGEIAVQDNKA